MKINRARILLCGILLILIIAIYPAVTSFRHYLYESQIDKFLRGITKVPKDFSIVSIDRITERHILVSMDQKAQPAFMRKYILVENHLEKLSFVTEYSVEKYEANIEINGSAFSGACNMFVDSRGHYIVSGQLSPAETGWYPEATILSYELSQNNSVKVHYGKNSATLLGIRENVAWFFVDTQEEARDLKALVD